MLITELDAWIFHHPLKEPFRPSWVPGYTATNSSAVIYRLRSDSGLEGWAGGVAFADEAKGPVNLLRAYMLGIDAEDTDEIYGRLRSAYQTLGVRVWFAEVAVWDLLAKAQKRSISELLGGTRDRMRCYASTGELRTPDEAASHARRVIDQGFTGIKIRTRHPTIAEDLAMVRAVREAIGPDVALMCDANQAWRVDAFAKGPVWDLDRAIETAKGMEEFGVEWLEEPLEMFDFDGYAQLRNKTATPIAAGELHGDPGLVDLLMDRGGVDIVQPDLVMTGGFTGAGRIARRAQEKGLAFAPHTWTNGLGLAANLQLAASADNCNWVEYPYDPPGWTPEGRDVALTATIDVDAEGWVEVKGPGLGVEVDLEKLERFAMQI